MSWIWIVLGAMTGLIILLRLVLTRILRSQIYRTKEPVSATPADQGLEYEERWIRVGSRRLQSWFVEAPTSQSNGPALLLFQGGDDVIGELPPLLKYLHDQGFATLAFDYSGNGQSSGQPSPRAFHQDSMAAFELFQSLLPDRPKYLWGFSAGASRLLTILPSVQEQVEGAFLIGPLASIQVAAGDRLPIPEPLQPVLLPNYADNINWIKQVDKVPVTIIHSRDDELVPFHHARKLAAAGGENVELVPLQSLDHNDCWQPIHDEYWQPVFQRTDLT